ncbi:MAG: hypothetical protein AB1798_19750, partial [Spirochaetota bacterium]
MKKITVFLTLIMFLLVSVFLFAGGKQEAAKPKEEGPVTLKCAFIGGANYEELYKAIPNFEKETGIKVEIVYKGDGFQI